MNRNSMNGDKCKINYPAYIPYIESKSKKSLKPFINKTLTFLTFFDVNKWSFIFNHINGLWIVNSSPP